MSALISWKWAAGMPVVTHRRNKALGLDQTCGIKERTEAFTAAGIRSSVFGHLNFKFLAMVSHLGRDGWGEGPNAVMAR